MGASVRLLDQAIHLAEVRSGCAELDVGNQQTDLGLLSEALVLLQRSLAQHDLDALRQDAGQRVVRWPAWVGGAVVDGDDVCGAKLDGFGKAHVLCHRPIDEFFIADAIRVEQARDRGRRGDRVRHAARRKDFLSGPGEVGRDYRAGQGQLVEGRRQVHGGQRSQVAAVEEAVAAAHVAVCHPQRVAIKQVTVPDRSPNVSQLLDRLEVRFGGERDCIERA